MSTCDIYVLKTTMIILSCIICNTRIVFVHKKVIAIFDGNDYTIVCRADMRINRAPSQAKFWPFQLVQRCVAHCHDLLVNK